ncbi:MAG: hypothetical protein K2Y39_02930 [Candidatus Obscuribacterales bacterium]|nr:hypothetical protein [Candidatus Obscuribacterales bacterium]
MQVKVLPQMLSGIVCAIVFFACGAAGGWLVLIAPAEGPKGPFDIDNVEILMICGLVPAVLGSALGVIACRIVERRAQNDVYK